MKGLDDLVKSLAKNRPEGIKRRNSLVNKYPLVDNVDEIEVFKRNARVTSQKVLL